MFTHRPSSISVAELPPRSDDDQPPVFSPQNAGGTISQHRISAEIERQLAALGAANLSGMMMAQTVMRHVLKPKAMNDAWAQFMHAYRHLFHTQGYKAADVFALREAIRLLESRRATP